MKRLHLRLLTAGALALVAASCAQNNGDINRVQPNVMKKADLLDGQWYFRNTVTWAPATTGFTFTGETGKLEKLVFEIRQNDLVGYRAYPFMPGSEGNVEQTSTPSGTTATYCQDGKCVGGQKYYGAPVVAYRIDGHFDIQRNYNPATGETGNVIQENAFDRPWNEREFIRVNWSSSWVNPGTDMMWGTVQNPGLAVDGSAWVQENEPGTDPYDWPRRETQKDANGTERLTYFDFTGRYFARPGTVYYEDYGEIPLCWLSPRYDCTASEIRMRTSLSKIDAAKTNDYEPLVYGNDLMNRFGYFRTERLTYDRKFGVTEQGVIYLANRFNIWKETFRKDAAGNPDTTQPIPFAERTPKPIVYYVNSADRGHFKDPSCTLSDAECATSTYKQYLESTRELQAHWDVAFRRAAAAAMGKDVSEVPQMLYVCENPVPAKDTLTGQENPANGPCGAPGTSPRMGDLRYSFLYTITDPTPNGLLGYGPSSADPETGEIISANANTYTGAVDSQAQYGLDLIDTLTGDKSIDDLISGEDVRGYFAALENQSYASTKRKLSRTGNGVEVLAENQSVARTNAPSLGAFQKPTAKMQNKFAGMSARGGLPEATQDRMKVAADMLAQDPALESAVLDNPEMKDDVLGLLPAPVAERALKDAAYARQVKRTAMLNLPALQKLEQQRLDFASRHNMYLAEFFDRPMMGLAKREAARRAARLVELKAQGMDDYNAKVQADREVRRRLQQAVWRATSEHEIGHTFGLRHNFQASFDSVNYFDRYWQLKKSFLTVNQAGQKVLPRTPADLRAVSDATALHTADETAEHAHDNVFEYEYSSIMDYGGKVNADFSGIGKYDEAAILFAYSGGSEPGYVEVFKEVRPAGQPLTVPGSDGKQVELTAAGLDIPVVNAQRKSQAIPSYLERVHYSTVPMRMGEGANLDEIIESGIARLKASNRTLAKWADVKAAEAQLAARIDGKTSISAADVADVPLEVPYMFCTDDHVGYVLSCNRFDRGPDYFEMTRQWLEDYWNGYYFSHFRRDRYLFSADRAVNSAFNAFDSSALVYKHWVRQFFKQDYGNQQVLASYGVDPLLQDTWTMAALDGANELIKVMSVPPSGTYLYFDKDASGNSGKYFGCQDPTTREQRSCWAAVDQGDEFRFKDEAGADVLGQIYQYYYGADYSQQFEWKRAWLGRGEGRRMYSRYDFRSGFGFFNRMVEVGHYYDQFGAMFAAVMPQAIFLDADDTADQRRYYIPYYLVFGDELSTSFGNIWSNNEADRAPTLSYALDANGTPNPRRLTVTHQNRIHGDKYVEGFTYPLTPPTPAPAAEPHSSGIETTWSARIYSIYLGMALFNVNYDLDYAKQNQVFRVGSAEAFPLPVEQCDANGQNCTYACPDGALTCDTTNVLITVDDPSSGARYGAVKSTAPGARVTPAMAAILQTRNRWKDYEIAAPGDKTIYLEIFKDGVRDLDMMRGMYAVYGKVF